MKIYDIGRWIQVANDYKKSYTWTMGHNVDPYIHLEGNNHITFYENGDIIKTYTVLERFDWIRIEAIEYKSDKSENHLGYYHNTFKIRNKCLDENGKTKYMWPGL